MKSLRRYFVTGLLTLIPIWATWFVIAFFSQLLSDTGRPWVNWLSKVTAANYPAVSTALLKPWFSFSVAIVLTLAAIILLGMLASRVIGRRMLHFFESIVSRIPLIQTVYGSVKKVINVVRKKPDEFHRVVLIAFPSRDMKTVGFVTQMMKDVNGLELAAVYVPTTPNPTSGYMEIVPVDQIIYTDWTLEEAMTFVVSAGAVTPGSINYGTPTNSD